MLHIEFVRETDDRFPNNTIKPGGSAREKLHRHFLNTYDAPFSKLQRELLQESKIIDAVLEAIEKLVDEKLFAVTRLREITKCEWSHLPSYHTLLMEERAKLMIFVLRPVNINILEL
jgi:hypothetical protein